MFLEVVCLTGDGLKTDRRFRLVEGLESFGERPE